MLRIEAVPETELARKWVAWLGDIDADLTDIAWVRLVWRAEEAMLREHDDLPPSDIFHVRARNYGVAQAVGVRRQIDKRTDIISLRRLLDELQTHPEEISRDFYVGRAEWGIQWKAHQEFDDWAGEGGAVLDVGVVAANVSLLEAATDKVRVYVNKHVAHSDTKKSEWEAPTFAELDEAIDALFELFCRYQTLFIGVGRVVMALVPQYDLLAPYDRPWRKPRRRSVPT